MGERLTKSSSLLVKQAGTVGEKTIKAVVTAPTLDRDGDIIDTASLHVPLQDGSWKYASELIGDEAIDLPFLIDHDFSVENVIGSVRSAYINTMGELEVVFGMSNRSKAQEMFTLLDEGHLNNAFSITVSYDSKNIDNGVLYEGELIEISLVFKGSNRNARLLEVSKAILKGENMEQSKKSPELKAKYKQLEELTKEIEAVEHQAEAEVQKAEIKAEAENKDVEVKAEAEVIVDDKADDKEKVEADPVAEVTEEVVEAEEVTEEVIEEVKEPVDVAEVETANKSIKKESKKMTEDKSKKIAKKSAQTKVKEVELPKIEVKEDKNAHKLLAYKQITAMKNHDWATVEELNKEAKRLDEKAGLSSKAIMSKEVGYTDAEPLYLSEQLSSDIEECRGDYGSLSSLVTNITLTSSPKFRIPTVEGNTSFVPVGWEGEKPEDNVTFDDVSIEPKPFAFIQVWSDHAAEDAQIALYDLMVRNIAEADAELDDKLIATFATETADGVVYPNQGILAQIDPGNVIARTPLDGTDFWNKMIQAVAMIRSCDRNNVSFAMNSVTLYEMATMRNESGDLIFTNGNTVNLGIAGSFRYVTSDTIPVGDVIVGNFRRYYLGKKEGLSLTTNNLGVVGSSNLYTTDKTALRAVVRREGAISASSLAGSFYVVRSQESSS